jgi:hypothetical protein
MDVTYHLTIYLYTSDHLTMYWIPDRVMTCDVGYHRPIVVRALLPEPGPDQILDWHALGVARS